MLESLKHFCMLKEATVHNTFPTSGMTQGGHEQCVLVQKLFCDIQFAT